MTSTRLNPQSPGDRLPSPYLPEQAAVAACLAALQGALDWPRVVVAATPWVEAVRENPPPFWAMESLLKEYPISSAEGLALMRLAEALLRVPDFETAIALTADQLGRADFDATKQGAMATLSQQAIALSKRFLPEDASGTGGLMAKLGAKTVVAATVRAVSLLGRQFVLGQTIALALDEAASQRQAQPNLRFSYDMLGEGARTSKDAEAYFKSYENAIINIANYAVDVGQSAKSVPKTPPHAVPGVPEHSGDGISIKLSALHPRYEWSQRTRVMAELVPTVWLLCERAAKARMNLTIDAEEVDRLELSLDVLDALCAKVAAHHPEWQGLGLAMQAYGTRSLALVGEVARIAKQHGIRLMCRLVKGAYWDFEAKRAQELGLAHYPVFTHKHHTDISYLACAKALLDEAATLYPQFATHNAATVAAIAQMAHRVGLQPGQHYELQRLHGMGGGVYREVLQDPRVTCRIYAPVGSHKDLLAYLVRRLLENGANASFVHQLADETVATSDLLLSPLRMEAASGLVLPPLLFGATRKNCAGLDLAVHSMRTPLAAAVASCPLPKVADFDANLIDGPAITAFSSYKIWSKLAVEERAKVLCAAADLLEQATPRFCAMLVVEAHKTWGDAVSEVREAVDFLRFYAADAVRIMAPIDLPGPTGETNQLRLRPRGVWVCISPWNFPLAIFLGQVAAALATGNAVLAKPAEQTPAVALAAAELLYSAGLPRGVLQLVCGPGETVGAALVALPGVAGVVFTGSTQVARIINRALAAKEGPITPLIAETGGINAMVVDSSALPEQVCDAVVASAFRSAGQRCSALRLLCVHEAIADTVLEMINGAVQELQVGDAKDPATDVGPVIDLEAFEGIAALVEELKTVKKGRNTHFVQHPRHLFATEKIANVANVANMANSANAIHVVVPTLVEVAHIADVRQEIFGPVLQVVRWGRGDLADPQAVVEQINALGYGLTLGIQTRIDSRAQHIADSAHVGNVYVNRNMTGAVVGVQPFGGEGLSGTGPKAGGPHYLLKFCAEQVVTVNTTAAGGNVQLLA